MQTLQNFTEFIPFGNFSVAEIESALSCALENASKSLNSIENTQTESWYSLQQSLYLPLYKLNQLWGIVNHLQSVQDSPDLRKLQESYQSKISEYYVNLGQSKKLYDHFKQIKQDATLGEEESRILDNQFRDFKLSGIELTPEQQQSFKTLQNELSRLTTKFEQNVLDCTDNFVKFVTIDELTGVPEDSIEMYRQAAIEAGQPNLYKITLHMPSYLPIMQYCENRILRQELYYQYVTRASEFGDIKLDNSPLICQILKLRSEKAKLLGFKNYTELSLFTKMAKDSAQVLDFLYQLASKSKSNASKDIQDLEQFAVSHCAIAKLEVWDIPYVSEKLQQHKYSYSNWELKQYFQLPIVLSGLFKLIYNLYQVEFKLNTSIPLWNPNMLAYDVIHQGQITGTIYMDLFARNGKQSGAWMDSLQDRFYFADISKKPMACIICNFTGPSATNDISLLTFDEVQTLFHEMGHALHHLLTKIKHCGISGINGVEWDAVELPSQFMEYFAWNINILNSITCHIDSGLPIPDDLYHKLLNSRYFQSSLAMLRQLEFAILDILLHQEEDFTKENCLHLVEKVRSEVAVIVPPAYNRFLNSFSHIFGGSYASGYYSYKWAEVLATDIFSKFDELPDNDYTKLGKIFHDTVLSQGGLKPMLQNFIAFMGREPQIDALLKYSGIN